MDKERDETYDTELPADPDLTPDAGEEPSQAVPPAGLPGLR